MISFANIRLSVYTWINKQLGQTVGDRIVWTEQGEVRPTRPYIGMRILSGPVRHGSDELRFESEEFQVCGMRSITISIQAFGAESLELMSYLQSSLEKPTVQADLSRAGIAFIRAEAIQNLTVALDTRYESRSQMDVVFGVSENQADSNLSYFDQVQLN